MAKKEKNIIEAKWLNLKEISKSDNPDLEQIDLFSCDLLANLAELTVRNVTEIEGVSIDLYKDRVWWVIEKHGMLPEYKDEDEEDEIVEILDDWNSYDDEFENDFEIDEEEIYKGLEL